MLTMFSPITICIISMGTDPVRDGPETYWFSRLFNSVSVTMTLCEIF